MKPEFSASGYHGERPRQAATLDDAQKTNRLTNGLQLSEGVATRPTGLLSRAYRGHGPLGLSPMMQLLSDVGNVYDQLVEAGVLLASDGPHPTAKGIIGR